MRGNAVLDGKVPEIVHRVVDGVCVGIIGLLNQNQTHAGGKTERQDCGINVLESRTSELEHANRNETRPHLDQGRQIGNLRVWKCADHSKIIARIPWGVEVYSINGTGKSNTTESRLSRPLSFPHTPTDGSQI